ncbi:MAG: flagellar basal-body protein FlbY, partial [Brevundimonas sp.]|nr:flagellar basal-body protein FlbY [Brevundimonas sp.]
MNDAAATLNASARLRQLIDLTQRLTARLSTELAAFEARRPQDVAAGLAETQDLANLYRRESAQVKAHPATLAAAPAVERMALVEATRAFETV